METSQSTAIAAHQLTTFEREQSAETGSAKKPIENSTSKDHSSSRRQKRRGMQSH